MSSIILNIDDNFRPVGLGLEVKNYCSDLDVKISLLYFINDVTFALLSF